MNTSLLAVGAAAVCSGTAAVLQASAVGRLPTATAVSGGFLVRLVRSPRYLGALALIAVGAVVVQVRRRGVSLRAHALTDKASIGS